MPEEFTLISVFPIITIYLGSTLCAITFFGVWASVKESPKMTKAYIVLLIIACVFQVSFSTYYFLKRSEIAFKSMDVVKNVWDLREESPEILDGVHLIGQCCGLHSYVDFNDIELPASCCGYDDKKECCTFDGAYKEGCYTGFIDFYLNNVSWIVFYGFFIAGIQFGAVLLAFFVKFENDKGVIYKKDLI